MFRTAATAAVLMTACATGVLAQGITGGTLGVEVDVPTDFNDFGGTTYFGGLEYGINRSFSIAGDVSSYRFEHLGSDATSATLHGIYHLSDSASVGAFFGQDRVEDGNSNTFGLEGGTEFQGGFVEGYFGKTEGDAYDGTFFGADAAYSLQNGFALTGSLGAASLDQGDVNKIAIGGGYTLQAGPELYAEVGRISDDTSEASDAETYIGLGARINFGAARGTTFDQRSVFEILPQF